MENQKLFIGNLSYEVTEEDIRTLLAPFGTVIEFSYSKKKGRAVVGMATDAEANAVLKKLNAKEFLGRKLRVTPEVSSKKAKASVRKQYKEQGMKIDHQRKTKKRERNEK